jgi:hypothetical protein
MQVDRNFNTLSLNRAKSFDKLRMTERCHLESKLSEILDKLLATELK